MTENLTLIGRSTGPAHSGSGPQYNHLTTIYTGVPPWKFGESTHWSTSHLKWLIQRYDHPTSHGEAARRIEDEKAVVVSGMPGSGRRAAALSLLIGDADVEHVRIRLLRKWWAESLEGPRTTVAPGKRLLLDLTGLAGTEYAEACSAVHELHGLAEANDARLAIVDDDRPESETELERLRVRIGRPDPDPVFSKYWKAEGFLPADQEISSEQREYLASMPMRVMPRVMTLIRDGWRADPRADAAQWINGAFQALQRTEVDEQAEFGRLVAALPDVRRRSLLLTGALFNDFPVDAVHVAHTRLLKDLRSSEDGPTGLAADGFVDQLAQCGIQVGDDPSRRIRFTRLDFDTRALRYFWDNYPELGDPVIRWICAAASMRELSSADRGRMLDRLAAESLRTHRLHDLIAAAEGVMDKGRPVESARLCYRLLAAGLDHGQHGAYFRRYLNDVSNEPSRQARQPVEYTKTLIDLCISFLAQNYPEQAVVRLHKFCGAPDERARAYARDALLDLVRRDQRALRWLIRRIVDELGDRARNADLFVRAASPARTPGSRLARIPDDDLARGWRLVIAACSNSPILAQHLDDWLGFCLDRAAPGADRAPAPQRDRALRILAEAAKPSFALQSRLEAAALRWADAPGGDPADRYPVADQLAVLIDSVAATPADLPRDESM